MLQKKIVFIAFLTTLSLVGCGDSSTHSAAPLRTSASKSAIVVIYEVAKKNLRSPRPSAMLGTYSALFTSQGVFLPVDSARTGIEAQTKILEGQNSPVSNETFALLIEVGGVLQVDLLDSLNRAHDRSAFLDEYIQSLKNAGSLIERKVIELAETQNNLEDKRKEQRSEKRETDKELKTALREQNYAPAAELEERLATQSGDLAETEIKLKQTKDIKNRFSELGEVTARRLQAIENNREIILAGLRVINVPGIDDLRILEEGSKWNRGGSVFSRPR